MTKFDPNAFGGIPAEEEDYPPTKWMKPQQMEGQPITIKRFNEGNGQYGTQMYVEFTYDNDRKRATYTASFAEYSGVFKMLAGRENEKHLLPISEVVLLKHGKTWALFSTGDCVPTGDRAHPLRLQTLDEVVGNVPDDDATSAGDGFPFDDDDDDFPF